MIDGAGFWITLEEGLLTKRPNDVIRGLQLSVSLLDLQGGERAESLEAELINNCQ
jgi:hypothetical protein